MVRVIIFLVGVIVMIWLISLFRRKLRKINRYRTNKVSRSKYSTINLERDADGVYRADNDKKKQSEQDSKMDD